MAAGRWGAPSGHPGLTAPKAHAVLHPRRKSPRVGRREGDVWRI
ncbi:hypothetical protein TOK_0761 [Pseudonocardia sp. N23]|nr:hypothetical protein TOK_0761 [Pseudonocardia sp. N23]